MAMKEKRYFLKKFLFNKTKKKLQYISKYKKGQPITVFRSICLQLADPYSEILVQLQSGQISLGSLVIVWDYKKKNNNLNKLCL